MLPRRMVSGIFAILLDLQVGSIENEHKPRWKLAYK